MGTGTGGGREGKQPAELLEGPEDGVPPAALWSIVRWRILMLECEAVLWEVALALLGVPPWQRQDYHVVLRNVPVPGSARTRPFFGALMREWWMVHPEPPLWRLWPPWPPAMLFALVGLVEATEGARWSLEILRGFCWRLVTRGAPRGRRPGRPPSEAFRRAEEFVVAWERAYHRDRQGRLDGRVCWDHVREYLARLGYRVGDHGLTPAEEKLRTNFARRQRTLRRRRGALV